MRIFNRHLEGLSLLSCCTTPEENPSPSVFDGSVKIEHHQPRPIPAPSPIPRGRTLSRDKEWLTRTKSFVSCVSTHRSIAGLKDLDSDKFSRCSYLPASPSPTSPAFCQLRNDLPSAKDPIFQPLSLRLSKSENEWASVITQVCSQMTPVTLSDEKQPLRAANTLDYVKQELSISENVEKMFKHLDLSLKPEVSDKKPQPKFLSHIRVKSEPATFERIKSALDESYKLTQRLKDLENDIERKSIYLSSRPSSPVNRKENFSEVSVLPHPLKSAPTHPFKRPSGRSLSLNSQNIRPDWGTPLPPLPLVLKTSISKKEKNISRVSSWLISSNQNEIPMPSNSITNLPRPVTDREFFYQCLGPSQLTTGTTISVSDCNSDQPTVWTSNFSSPAIKSDFSGFELAEDYDQNRKSLEYIIKTSDLSKNFSNTRSKFEEISTGIAI